MSLLEWLNPATTEPRQVGASIHLTLPPFTPLVADSKKPALTPQCHPPPPPPPPECGRTSQRSRTSPTPKSPYWQSEVASPTALLPLCPLCALWFTLFFSNPRPRKSEHSRIPLREELQFHLPDVIHVISVAKTYSTSIASRPEKPGLFSPWRSDAGRQFMDCIHCPQT